MNDYDFLDLFALDPIWGGAGDIAEEIGHSFNLPDLPSCIPDPFDAIETFPCPPIAGGAPNILDDIREVLKDLWDKIWGWIGGAIRWFWNQVWAFISWITSTVTTIWQWVTWTIPNAISSMWGTVNTIWDWVTRKIPDAIGWVKGKLTDVWDTARGLWTWTSTWLWPKVTDIWDRTTRFIPDALGWIKNKLVAVWDFLRIDLWGHIAGAAQGIGSAITDAFRDFVEMVQKGLDALRDALVDAIKWPWEHIMEPFGNIVEEKLGIPRRLIRGEYRDLLDFFDDIVDPPIPLFVGIVGAIILGLVIGMVSAGITQVLLNPLCEPHVQTIRAGVGAELLTVGVIQDALNRDFISEATAKDHLSRGGYDDTASKALLDLRYYIPPPTDLIRMAVREVFDPDARKRLDLDAEFPSPFGEWADKLGISQEWAGNYWAMHWDLPSPSQGYEMLHRGLIEPPELADLLKALDYAPVWRDKLRDIAYSPITRVDLRRLYKGGVIYEDDVFHGYKALGYDDEKARWLTDWTKKYYSPEDESELDKYTEATASQIRLAYRRHVILRPEALDKLVELGYSEDSADFLLAIDDAQLALNPLTDLGVPVRDLTVSIIRNAYAEKLLLREPAQDELEALGYLAWEADLLLQLEDVAQQRELTGLAETVVKELYLANAIDEAEAGRQLDALEVLPERRDLLLQRWQLQKAQKPKRLTLAQLQAGFRQDLLTDTQLLGEFTAMGYNDKDAMFLVDSTDKEPANIERRLSASQLQRACKAGLVSDDQLSQQLIALGYSQPDAELLVKMSVPTTVEKARQLSVSMLQVALRSGLLTDAEFLTRATTLGYSQADVELLVKMAAPAPADKARQLSASQLQVGFRSGLVTEVELLDKLAGLGYAQADAELLRDIAAKKPEPQPRRLAVANLKDLFKAGTIDKAGLLAELLTLKYSDRDAGWLADLIAPEE